MKNQTSDKQLEILSLLLAAKSTGKPLLIKRVSKGDTKPNWAFAKVTQINIESGEICVTENKKLRIEKIYSAQFPGRR